MNQDDIWESTNREYETSDGNKHIKNDYRELLSQAAQVSTVINRPRRHVVTWHDPAPAGVDNPKQLPKDISQHQTASFHIYTGPKPTDGCVIVRVGLDNFPGMDRVELSVRLNDVECKQIEDLKRNGPFVPDGDNGTHVVKTVAEVAPRVMQFRASPASVRQGYNAVHLSLRDSNKQRIIWLEIYIHDSQ